MSDDTKLSELQQFTGTQHYHSVMGVNVTDGVAYVMENGYSWFVTDMLVILRMKLSSEEFCSVKLKLDGTKAKAVIENGNGKILYEQAYDFTDAKKEITLFYTDNVLMLNSEY